MNGTFDIGELTPTRYFFSIAVLLGLLFAMISPEENKPGGLIYLQWQLQAVTPMALMVGAHILMSHSKHFANLNAWAALSISGFIGASVFAPIALLIDVWLDPEFPENLLAEFFDEWLSVMPPVIICWLGVNAPWLLGFRLEKSAIRKDEKDKALQPGDSGNIEAVESVKFLSLLSPDKRGKLLLLKAELHYLLVVTDAGSALILYNLSDAVGQLPQDKGMMTHRSYWVALNAVTKLVKRGRQGELHIQGGHTVPVSRSRLKEVSARISPQQ